MNGEFSVVIPLYNKASEIGRTLQSVLDQTLPPAEILIVDDGSTDGSVAVLEQMDLPATVRIIRQQNRGVSAARNVAIREARCRYVALLDGDDRWEAGYLAEIARLVDQYPGAVAYATSFMVDDGVTLTPPLTPETEGFVDFFRESMTRYVLIPSAAVLNRETVLAAGGFPEGMRLGEDQWLWVHLARRGRICCSTARLVVYSKAAENRSASIWQPENTPYTLEELYNPIADDPANEYIARVALGKFLVVSAKGGTAEAARAARFFSYTKLNRKALWKLRVLNSLPVSWRQPVLDGYNRLAWRYARKGL